MISVHASQYVLWFPFFLDQQMNWRNLLWSAAELEESHFWKGPNRSSSITPCQEQEIFLEHLTGEFQPFAWRSPVESPQPPSLPLLSYPHHQEFSLVSSVSFLAIHFGSSFRGCWKQMCPIFHMKALQVAPGCTWLKGPCCQWPTKFLT